MKNFIYFNFCICFLFSSCFQQGMNQIKYHPNDFGDGSKYLLKQRFIPGLFSTAVNDCIIQYERVTEGTNANRVHFLINRKVEALDFVPTIHLKIDDLIFHIKINRVKTQLQTENETSSNQTMTTDTTGNVMSSSSSSSTQNSWFAEKFYIDLPIDAITNIERAKKISYRFYYGPEPVTLEYDKDKLKLLKELFSKK